MNSVIGIRGFVSWVHISFLEKIRLMCQESLIKYSVHALGLSLMIFGVFPIIKLLHPLSLLGIFILLFGLVLFVTPLGVEDD